MGSSSKKGGTSFDIGDIEDLLETQFDFSKRAARHSARFNQFDQIGPQGSVTFKGRPGSVKRRQITRLPKRQRQAQRKLEKAGLRQIRNVQDLFSQPIGGQDSFQSAADAVEQATFDRGQNLLQPGFEQSQERLENQLVQRGLPRSGEAFGTESDRLSQQQGDVLENLALQSVGAGRQEQSRLLNAELARRQGALGEIGSLVGGKGAPQFQPGTGVAVQPPNVNNAFSLLAQQGANQSAGKAAGKGGLFGLGSAGILAAPHFGGKGSGAAALGGFP